VSKPFYENSNYYIMKLNDRKAFVNDPNSVKKVKVKHAFVPIAGNLPQSEIIKIQENIKSNIAQYKSCDGFARFAKNIGSKIPSDTIDVNLDELNPQVRPAISQTEVDGLTTPIESPDGLHIFGICEKEKPQTSVILKDRLKEMLTMRKLDLQAQRYLQQLRDKAFIEIRM
jgi:peptidyl-prolyl cis-trans isomerase SurA